LFLEPCSRQAVHWKRSAFRAPVASCRSPTFRNPDRRSRRRPFGTSRFWKEGGIGTKLLLVLPIRSHLLVLKIPSNFRLCHRCRLIFLWLPQVGQLITQRSVVQIHPPQPTFPPYNHQLTSTQNYVLDLCYGPSEEEPSDDGRTGCHHLRPALQGLRTSRRRTVPTRPLS